MKQQLSYHPLAPANGIPDEWQVYKGKKHLFTIYQVTAEESSLFRIYQERTGEKVAEKSGIKEAKRWCEKAYALKMHEATEITRENNFGLF
jgi:hypothetical protein